MPGYEGQVMSGNRSVDAYVIELNNGVSQLNETYAEIKKGAL